MLTNRLLLFLGLFGSLYETGKCAASEQKKLTTLKSEIHFSGVMMSMMLRKSGQRHHRKMSDEL